MATALQQVKSADSASSSALAITVTSSLSGSVLWVMTCGGSIGATALSLPTDSATQTYTNLTPQVGTSAGMRLDDFRNTASGVTSVTVHATSAVELSGTVQELTGTNNTLDSTVPIITSGTSTSAATNSITTATGSILAAGVSDAGGTNSAYTVSPAAYVIDGLTPNGTHERQGSATAADVASGAHVATFTLPVSANWVCGQAAYKVSAAGGGLPPGDEHAVNIDTAAQAAMMR